MLALRLFVLYFVCVREQTVCPVDLNSRVCLREANCKLPNETIIPVNYNLEITPKYAKYKEKDMPFKAEVDIQFILNKNVSCFNLNMNNLELDLDNFHLKTIKETIIGCTIEQDPECEFIHITKRNYIFKQGSYKLKIAYDGFIPTSSHLFNENHGIFKGVYKNNKNESTMFISTRTYPLLAHTLFPCFNEPKYKATFQLKINNGRKYKVISNTPIIKQTSDTTEFMTTPSMPPFSLSFTIGDFENISNCDEFAVHVRPDIVKYARFGLDTATLIFKAYEKYFDLLPREIFKTFRYKLDLVGLPDIQGPENGLGVITFNEKYLIYDEENPPLAAVFQGHVETIAEAIVQQWFGNIISVKDWKYNWINDGLSIFSARHIIDKIEDKWRSMDQFVVDNILNTVIKYHHEGETPLENNDFPLYNTVSIQKAPATIRMMHHFLTEPVFRRGLQLYLTRNLENPVDSNDFLNALQNAAYEANMNISLKAVMKGWLEYPGYPVLNVTIDHDNNQMKITQKRFRSEDLSEQENVTNLWHIPINYATAAKPDFHITIPDQWIKDDETTINIQVEKEQWIILNKQVTGFYRINYNKENWDLIIKYLKSADREKIHALNRAQLLIDALAFVQQNTLDLKIFLELTTYLKDEKDYITWLAASKAFEWLDNKLFNSELYPAFKNFSVNSIQNWIKLVGYEEKANDEHIIKISREEALKHACKYGDSSCLSMMEEKFKKWLNAANDAEKNKIMPPDNVHKMICWGLQNGNSDLWNVSLTLLLNSEDMTEKLNLIRDLGCSRNKTTLKYYLNFTFRDNSPLLEYTESVIDSIYSESDVAFDVVFEFVMEEYNIFVEKISRQKFVDEIFFSLVKKITTETNLKKLQQLKLNLSHIHEASKIAGENIKWIEINKKILSHIFEEENENGWPDWVYGIIFSVGAFIFIIFLVIGYLIKSNNRTNPRNRISPVRHSESALERRRRNS